MQGFSVVRMDGPPRYDFQVGRRWLVPHFDLEHGYAGGASTIPRMCVLATTRSSRFAAQLLGRSPTEFPSDRVPLFVCGCEALGCGSLTVRVDIQGTRVTWSHFGWLGPLSNEVSQGAYMERMRPVEFEWEGYLAELQPFL